MKPRKIRVLIVDDSAVVRKMASVALGAAPEIEVVGTAVDPYVARDLLRELKPDVLTLDLEMPRMDGLTFLRLLMERRPTPVIVMSSLTQRGSDYALEALRLGAVDVLGKPSGSYSFGDLGPQLVAKVKVAALARVRPAATTLAPSTPTAAPATNRAAAPAERRATDGANQPTPRRAAPTFSNAPFSASPFSASPFRAAPPPAKLAPEARTKRFEPRSLILLGASTGGTEALRDVLTALPAELPPIAIVQHIPAMFSKAFADRLNSLSALEVREAVDGDVLRPGLALVAPGNFHLLVHWTGAHYRARVVSGPPVWHQRPAVDLLFKSAADCGAAPHSVAGLLTGMGRDGADGLLKLREKGADTFAQDEASCVVYGMPKVAWETGAAQLQLPLSRVAAHLVSRVEQHVLSTSSSAPS